MIEAEQSLLICQFIEDILHGRLPGKIEITSNGPPVRIKLKKFIKKWHGGGAYKGRVEVGKYAFFSISNAIIARSSLVIFRNNLIDLYNLKNRETMNTTQM